MTMNENKQAEPVAWEHHAKKLIQWLHCMSHNDSYFGEPAGLVKQVTHELYRLLETHPAPAVAQPPADVVRELVEALKCVAGWSQSPNRYIPDTCIDQVKDGLKSAKEHGL